MSNYFESIPSIQYEGPDSTNPLSFKHYNPKEVIGGKTMEEHLRFAVCYWHNFCWDGADVFGGGTFDRPWLAAGDPMERAKQKADVAFSFFEKLGAPFYCFHDIDVAPEGDSIQDYIRNFGEMTEVLARKQEETGMKLLWGTANVFSHPRYMSGAATNPNPEIFTRAATQVYHAMNATKALGGANYVLWGGREGYETLLNTDLKRERQQFGRFMNMVVEHKYKIGFDGLLLIEPKPQEPTKHQYDYDTATVYGFLKEFGLEKEFAVNIEANHATLSGHSFHHEVATAFALDIFGSIDANRGDPQLGWDTDQFPNSVEEMTLICYEILQNGGYTSGGFNFDTKLRRQSLDAEDLFLGHIGGMDTCALGLKKAYELISNGVLDSNVKSRYAEWNSVFGREILDGNMSLESLAEHAKVKSLDPKPVSGKQEGLENIVNQIIYK